MKRREFLKSAGVGAAAVAVAAPAIAQTAPELKWRLTSSFPKSLDTIYGAAEVFSKAVAEATDDKFRFRCSPPARLCPASQPLTRCRPAPVETCHTASYYFGKDPTFAFGTVVPFGLNTRMQNAWMFFGGAMDLMNDFYKKFNIYGIPAGNTGAQMGGWFRKEIKEVSDFNELKCESEDLPAPCCRSSARSLSRSRAATSIRRSKKGTIDAAEWVGPYDDEKLGFAKVAKYYYYPGWWEGNAMLHNFFNLDKWNALPASYKSILRSASAVANEWMIAKYDAANPGALRRLVASGAEMKPFSQPVLEACYKASNDIYAETSAKNPEFKKVYDSMAAFRGDEYLWWQVAEYTFDTFQIRALRRG